jgi:molybdopterin synthase catalytic subunit
MKIRAVQREDHDEWLRMRYALWPEYLAQQVRDDVADYHDTRKIWGLPTAAMVIDRGDGRLGGFIEASLRPFADGCVTSPVGYVEGWYVDEDLRRGGWGAKLVAAAEEWARGNGCVEMASDCASGNIVSLQSHRRLGFAHSDHLISFRKPLVDQIPAERILKDWIGLTPASLGAGASAVKFVTDPAAGGIDVFLGTTRAETNAEGKELWALDYEAYEEMATKQLGDLAHRARARWPIIKCAILHRVGRVKIGEPSVVIAVSTAHRGESFEACRWIIDTLKAEVAIWKKEVWEGGATSWVHPGEKWT